MTGESTNELPKPETSIDQEQKLVPVVVNQASIDLLQRVNFIAARERSMEEVCENVMNDPTNPWGRTILENKKKLGDDYGKPHSQRHVQFHAGNNVPGRSNERE